MAEEKKINFAAIEKKWQKKWEKEKAFEVEIDSKKEKYYVLDMFPYPSGEGLHMGHAFVFTLGDIYARFKRLKGFNVLYPIGYDSLGLPAENAAIKAGIHPEEYTKNSIANFMKQQKAMGWSYDWSRVVKTSDPDYYKWDQWIFLKMLEKGIAYRKKAGVNWCFECDSVLANEQVVNGRCWRHEDCEVEVKHLKQWFFKITDYADELLKGHDKIYWPDRAKAIQKNWIGRSEGGEINFNINGEDWPIFTTRADTIHGVTFMVVSAQHHRLMDLVNDEQKKDVEKFLKKIKSTSEKDMGELDKEGVFTGSYAVNPMTGEEIPVWAGNFVLADYGCGMVMAVPAHDSRDFAFAKKYGIPIKIVIQPDEFDLVGDKMSRAFTSNGRLVNSGEFDGINNLEAIDTIVEDLKKKKLAKKSIQYKLRDWLISRQRYWGTPIPIIYCDDCGAVPVPEKDLPVKLPKDIKFGKGNPLASSESFVNAKCPDCGKGARRETDTMDTFVNSSWYYLRYTDSDNSKEIFDIKKAKYWAPVDKYIGGPEHITMHLIYMRFYSKFLRDIGLIEFDEPALSYFTQGIVKGDDGEKMSKSRGNVVEPLDTIKIYGADTLRFYLISNGSSESDFDWDPRGVASSHKFINKIYNYFSGNFKTKSSAAIESKLNRAIKEVEEDISKMKHNLAIIKIRELFKAFSEDDVCNADAGKFLKLLHPYCPFITEELWLKLGNKKLISLSDWPEYDEKKIDEKLEEGEKAVDKTVSDIATVVSIVKDREDIDPDSVYLYVMPHEVANFSEDVLNKRTGKKVKVFAVNDKDKYDPEGKAKKAKPGKPGIFVE